MEKVVSIKELIRRAIVEMPDDATLEEAIDRISLFYEVEQGLKDVEQGQTMTTEEVKRSLTKWLK